MVTEMIIKKKKQTFWVFSQQCLIIMSSLSLRRSRMQASFRVVEGGDREGKLQENLA